MSTCARFLSSLLALLLLASCAPKEPRSAQSSAKLPELALGNGAEPADLDPHVATAFTDMNVLTALFEGLTVLDEASSKPLPGQAESWTTSKDGLVWTFKLRPDLRWSDGQALTAEDFVFSFRRILSPDMAAEFSALLWPLKNARALSLGQIKDPGQLGARVIDARTLELTLEEPCPWFLSLISNQAWFPVPRHVIEKHGSWNQRGTRWTLPGALVSNGPFRLQEWRPNARLVVEKNPAYWDAAQSKIERITFYPNENLATDERNFRTGKLQATYDLQPEKIASYRKENPAVLRIDPFFETFFLRLNTKQAPLNQAKVRLALAYAIDRAALCNAVLKDSRLPASSITPPGAGTYQAPKGPVWNPDKARQLLAEAGYPGGRGFPALELQFKSDDIHRGIMEAIQEMWSRELGIHATLAPLEQKSWLENQRTLSFQVTSSRWIGDYLDPNTFLELWLGDNGKNQTGWANAEYDKLIQEAAKTMDDKTRYELQAKAEALLLEHAPVVPIFYGTRVYLLQKDIGNWPPSALGLRRYQYISITEPRAP